MISNLRPFYQIFLGDAWKKLILDVHKEFGTPATSEYIPMYIHQLWKIV